MSWRVMTVDEFEVDRARAERHSTIVASVAVLAVVLCCAILVFAVVAFVMGWR